MPSNDSSTQVMNPLVGPSLSSRTSMHCLSSAGEPSMKKIRLAGSFQNNDEVATTKSAASLLSCEGGLGKSSSIAAIGKDIVLPSEAPKSSSNQTAEKYAAPTAKGVADTAKVTPSKSQPPNSDPPKENPKPSASDLPKKLTKFSHLKTKYHNELTYMLLEFEKLERQLLGARKTEESAGSRERREKLHSFILHLQDTIQQIEAGDKEEQAKNSAKAAAEAAGTAAAASSDDDADTVQKLEEHILVNLLPVKVRLKKQLAAQQGARHNPVGMPHSSQWNQNTDGGVKGTFAAAAEKRRKEAEEAFIEPREPARPVDPDQTQYGKPIDNSGSSLTKKLHGQTLGNKGEDESDSTVKPEAEQAKRYYGGMALGSNQIESSVTAASSVHKLMVRDTEKMIQSNRPNPPQETEAVVPSPKPPPISQSSSAPAQNDEGAATAAAAAAAAKLAFAEPKLDPEELERRRRRRRRRRKRAQREQELRGSQPAEMEVPKAKKARQVKKQRGPRQVEYLCALCNESYNSTCEYNPWWALAQHDCPKCHKTQVPKVDISAAANAIEYHPALLAHADDNGGAAVQPPPPPPEVETVASSPPVEKAVEDTVSLGSDVSSGLEDVSSDDEDSFDLDSDIDSIAMTPADRAENENFGALYEGPTLEDSDASRLLVLMVHASTCAGQHRSQKQRDVCRSTRWMMLHVRDCPGTTSSFDICPFPWCRKVKHLLYHLVSCSNQDTCSICSNPSIGGNLFRLKGLNDHRLNAHKEQLHKRFPLPRLATTSRSMPPTKAPAESKTAKLASKTEQNAKLVQQGTKNATQPKTPPKVEGSARVAARPDTQHTNAIAKQAGPAQAVVATGSGSIKAAPKLATAKPATQTSATAKTTPQVSTQQPVLATAAKTSTQIPGAAAVSPNPVAKVSSSNPPVCVKVEQVQVATNSIQPGQTVKTSTQAKPAVCVKVESQQNSTPKPPEPRQANPAKSVPKHAHVASQNHKQASQQLRVLPVQTGVVTKPLGAGAAATPKTAVRVAPAASTQHAAVTQAAASQSATATKMTSGSGVRTATPSETTTVRPAVASQQTTASTAKTAQTTVPSQQRVVVAKSAPRTVQLVVTTVSGHATGQHMQTVSIVPAGAKLVPAPSVSQPSSASVSAPSAKCVPKPSAAKPAPSCKPVAAAAVNVGTTQQNPVTGAKTTKPQQLKQSVSSPAATAGTKPVVPSASTSKAISPASPTAAAKLVVSHLSKPLVQQAQAQTPKPQPSTATHPDPKPSQKSTVSTSPQSVSTSPQPEVQLKAVVAKTPSSTQRNAQAQPVLLVLSKQEAVPEQARAKPSQQRQTSTIDGAKSPPPTSPSTKVVKTEEPAPLLANVQAIVQPKQTSPPNATTQVAEKLPAPVVAGVKPKEGVRISNAKPSAS